MVQLSPGFHPLHHGSGLGSRLILLVGDSPSSVHLKHVCPGAPGSIPSDSSEEEIHACAAISAAQTQLFQNQLQGPRESVEQFVQDLCKLLNWAYAQATCEDLQAERWAKSSLLTNLLQGFAQS